MPIADLSVHQVVEAEIVHRKIHYKDNPEQRFFYITEFRFKTRDGHEFEISLFSEAKIPVPIKLPNGKRLVGDDIIRPDAYLDKSAKETRRPGDVSEAQEAEDARIEEEQSA